MADHEAPGSTTGKSAHNEHHEQHGMATHLVHYAHQAHLTAEALEFGAHLVHVESHVNAAQKLLKTHGQMAYDLARMHRRIFSLQNVAKQGGEIGAKASRALPRAEEAYKLANLAFERERQAVNTARTLLQETRAARSGFRGMAAVNIGKTALKLEAALESSVVGSKLLKVGKITASKPFVRGLIVVGAAAEGVASYKDSTAETTTGKAANAALGAGAGALVMLNPWVAGADVVAPEGYKLSEVYHGGAGAVTAIGEACFKQDSKAMDDFHKRSMQGSYGKVLQAASEAGEFWATKGIGGGLTEFADAVKWWVGH
jgi:hypothetical protein